MSYPPAGTPTPEEWPEYANLVRLLVVHREKHFKFFFYFKVCFLAARPNFLFSRAADSPAESAGTFPSSFSLFAVDALIYLSVADPRLFE